MPNNAQAQLQLGRLYLRKGDWQNAVTALEQAAKLAPGDAEAQARLGTADQYVGKKPEALAAYKKAVELDPKNIDYRTTYGLILGVNGQADAGAAELQKVVATPGYKDSDGYVNLGWLYRNTEPKKIDESIAAYKKALELNPKEEQAALGMGWSYINMKNWDAAIAAFNQADADRSHDRARGQQRDRLVVPLQEGSGQGAGVLRQGLRRRPRRRRASRRTSSGCGRIEAIEEAQLEAPPAAAAHGAAGCRPLSADARRARGSPSSRRKAASDLATFGAGRRARADQRRSNDSDWDVRETAANSLGAIGPKASAAIPHLMHILHVAPRRGHHRS